VARRSDDFLAEALRLPAAARAALAAELIRSLDDDEPAPEVEAAWGDEIRRRLAEIDAGRADTVPWAEVERDMLEVARRGESR
jgi:putative addiction module component (TIGR02574 family)